MDDVPVFWTTLLTMQDRFREQFLEALERSGMTLAELSRRSGVKYDALNKLKSREGASTSADNAARISRVLGLDDRVDTVPAFSESETRFTPSGDMVDIYNVQASAGHGAFVGHELVVDRLSFPPGYLRQITSSHPRNLAIIGVKGDSMQTTLADGDLVMIDTSKRDLSFDGLFVIQDGGASLLVKRIGRAARRGWVKLISDNRNYDPIEREVGEIDVVGKVIWKGVKE